MPKLCSRHISLGLALLHILLHVEGIATLLALRGMQYLAHFFASFVSASAISG